MKKRQSTRFGVVLFVPFVLFALLVGCATTPTETAVIPPYTPLYGVFANYITEQCITDVLPTLAAVDEAKLPKYWHALMDDGVLTVALCVGTEDLVNKIYDEKGGGQVLDVKVRDAKIPVTMYGKPITIDITIVTTKEQLLKAFNEREVIFVYSHSRYGNGWALHEEGLDDPFRMQSDQIRIPKNQMHGYQGEIVGESGGYYILKPNTTDIDKVVPYPGYQLIVGLSCTSKAQFMKELVKMRNGYPSTMILTTNAGGFLEMRFTIFKRFLAGILTGEDMKKLVSGMNDTWQKVPDVFFDLYKVRTPVKAYRVIDYSYDDLK
jgi:hypothetical protein